MRIDRELVRAWRRINHRGGVVVALRYDQNAHLATALIELDGGRRIHAMGYNAAQALDRCLAKA